MYRTYSDGASSSAVFFVGQEVEKTPAYGMQTLFVVGQPPVEEIREQIAEHDVKHIFFGANHSFAPSLESANDWADWEQLILLFLNEGYLCTLDIPLAIAEGVLESALVEHNNFIPQIRVALPYVKQWNYNTMIKIDDVDFAATNPGVWCHHLHDLMDQDTFTPWHKYNDDKVTK